MFILLLMTIFTIGAADFIRMGGYDYATEEVDHEHSSVDIQPYRSSGSSRNHPTASPTNTPDAAVYIYSNSTGKCSSLSAGTHYTATRSGGCIALSSPLGAVKSLSITCTGITETSTWTVSSHNDTTCSTSAVYTTPGSTNKCGCEKVRDATDTITGNVRVLCSGFADSCPLQLTPAQIAILVIAIILPICACCCVIAGLFYTLSKYFQSSNQAVMPVVAPAGYSQVQQQQPYGQQQGVQMGYYPQQQPQPVGYYPQQQPQMMVYQQPGQPQPIMMMQQPGQPLIVQGTIVAPEPQKVYM